MNGSDVPARRQFGLLAVAAAIMCFSISSTIIKKSGMPGTTLAFWRMVITTVLWWAILGATERRVVTRAELRRALVPGVIFGLNITLFFSGVTHTAVANAEFIGSLTRCSSCRPERCCTMNDSTCARSHSVSSP